MSFSFGGTPAPASQPNFSFGGAPTPAASGNTPASGGFSFASTSSTGTPATSSVGFSFGATNAAPATTQQQQQPSVNNNSTTPAPSGFSFGATNATPAPASTDFSFAGNSGTLTTTSNSDSNANVAGVSSQSSNSNNISSINEPAIQTTLTVPTFESIFPGSSEWMQILDLLDSSIKGDHTGILGEELQEKLASTNTVYQVLTNPPKADFETANVGLRQQLYQNPVVDLDGEPATLTQQMLEEQVLPIADDLHCSEGVALRLYAHLRQQNDNSISDNASLLAAARVLYFEEKSRPLRVLHSLIIERLEASPDHCLLGTIDYYLRNGNLVHNLIQLISHYSVRIHDLLIWQHSHRRSTNSMQHDGPDPLKSADLHASMWRKQRQIAAECLFFISYQVVLETAEVEALIDLIQTLTNPNSTGKGDGLLQLDPYNRVPNPFKTDDESSFQHISGGPLVEKSPTVWEDELISQIYQSGQPWLLRCVGVLVTTVMTALGAATYNSVMHDRNTHRLHQADTLLLKHVHPSLDAKFSLDAVSQWQRKDIWGLLASSYGLLQAETSLSNPQQSNYRQVQAWIAAPMSQRSITFARLTLIPAIQIPLLDETESAYLRDTSSISNVSEFMLTAVADYGARYLDVLYRFDDKPLSRAQWLAEAERDLKTRREEQERQYRSQHWSEPQTSFEEIPNFVDMCDRPDCVDDIIMFCVNVANISPELALLFWSVYDTESRASERHTSGTDDTEANEVSMPTLTFSSAIQSLEKQQCDDDTLLPCYLSLLAALCASSSESRVDGAAAVHSLLSRSTATSVKRTISYNDLLNVCRHYVKELNQVSSSSSRRSSPQASASTSYYYGSRDDNGHNMSSVTTSSKNSKQKSRELGEENTFILLSHLALLKSVATYCMDARMEILETKVAAFTADGLDAPGYDSSLRLLFALSASALTPEVRGAVFDTIAALLKFDDAYSDEGNDKMREMALLGWSLLEEYQIFPIYLFDQFPTIQPSALDKPPGLDFPSSSTALVGQSKEETWIPPESVYSIIYEMEYIEAENMVYTSTEGFLRLVNALVLTGGCPSLLGQGWRARSGCGPYIEYIMYCLLPRITGKFSGFKPLKFRTDEDKFRLTSAALDVIKNVASRYMVPKQLFVTALAKEKQSSFTTRISKKSDKIDNDDGLDESIKALEAHAKSVLEHDGLISETVRPVSRTVYTEYIRDYNHINAASVDDSGQEQSASSPASNNMSSQVTPHSMAPSIPLPKTPAFTVLSSILSASGGAVLHSLFEILIEGIHHVQQAHVSDRLALSMSLFGSTQPTFAATKSAYKSNAENLPYQDLLVELKPTNSIPSYRSASYWMEQSIVTALHILCIAASREDAISTALASKFPNLHITPHLVFSNDMSTRKINRWNLQVSKLADLMQKHSKKMDILSALAYFVGSGSCTDDSKLSLQTAAVSLLLYVDKVIQPLGGGGGGGGGLARECASNSWFEQQIVSSFAFCLQTSATKANLPYNLQCFQSITKTMSHQFSSLHQQNCLGVTLFGQKNDSSCNDAAESSLHQNNCLLSLISIIEENCYEREPHSTIVAAYALKTIVDACNWDSFESNFASKLFTTLNSFDFWQSGLVSITSAAMSEPDTHFDENMCHCLAWMIKGLTCDIHTLLNKQTESTLQNANSFSSVSYQGAVQKVISFLLCDDDSQSLLIDLLHMLPIVKVDLGNCPATELLQDYKVLMDGPFETSTDYYTIDVAALTGGDKSTGDTAVSRHILDWCVAWNASVSRNCASAHLTSAMSDLVEFVLIAQRECGFERVMGVDTSIPKVLEAFVTKLIPTDSNEVCIDDMCYTQATSSLANCTYTLSTIIKEGMVITEGYDRLFHNLCRSIMCSGSLSHTGPDTNLQLSRTSYLCGALANVLCTSSSGTSANRIDADTTYAAAVIAGRMAITRNTYTSQLSCHLATSCFVQILTEISETYDDKALQLFCNSFFNEHYDTNGSLTIVNRMLQLVSEMDNDVLLLLESLCQTSAGSRLAHDINLYNAMRSALDKYMEIEQRSNNHLQAFNHDLAVPEFINGHISIMSCLLDVPEEFDIDTTTQYRDVALHILHLVSRYQQPLLNRLFKVFPLQGDTISQYFQLLLLLCQHLPRDAGTRLVLNKFPADRTDPQSMKTYAFVFALQLAEYPLPDQLTCAFPRILDEQSYMHSYEATASLIVPTVVTKSWWTRLELTSTTLGSEYNNGYQLSDKLRDMLNMDVCQIGYSYGVLVSNGLRLSKYIGDMTVVISENMICKALVRISHACKVMQQSLSNGSYFQQHGAGTAYEESDLQQYWKKEFYQRLVLVLEDVLTVSLSYVQSLKKKMTMTRDIVSSDKLSSKYGLLRRTLDSLQMNDMSHVVQPSLMSNENNQVRVHDLYWALKKELDQYT